MPTPSSRPIVSAVHPLHVLLAAYPIAFFSGAFVTDIIYLNTAVMMWANFSVWLITGGLVMGVAAAVVGMAEALLSKNKSTLRPGWIHSAGNALVLALSLWNAFVHSRDAWTSVVPTGIILSGIVTVLVIVVNWLGTARTVRQLTGDVR
jgi:uncharacterized membrane protein